MSLFLTWHRILRVMLKDVGKVFAVELRGVAKDLDPGDGPTGQDPDPKGQVFSLQ